jgi:hypothetical protein
VAGTGGHRYVVDDTDDYSEVLDIPTLSTATICDNGRMTTNCNGVYPHGKHDDGRDITCTLPISGRVVVVRYVG